MDDPDEQVARSAAAALAVLGAEAELALRAGQAVAAEQLERIERAAAVAA